MLPEEEEEVKENFFNKISIFTVFYKNLKINCLLIDPIINLLFLGCFMIRLLIEHQTGNQ